MKKKNNGKNLVNTAIENITPVRKYFLSNMKETDRRIAIADRQSNIACTDDCEITNGDKNHRAAARMDFFSSLESFIAMS